MTAWSDQGREPAYGPLFRAALGGAAELFAGGTLTGDSTTSTIRFAQPHGLAPGQAVRVGSELRFVSANVDQWTAVLNAPLSEAPTAGTEVGRAVSYRPALDLPSVSIYDYWTPSTAVQRVLCGAAVDVLRIRVNGDYHEFEFSGLARDVIDSASFASGQGGLTAFPAEPAPGDFAHTVIPGNVGQAWLGAAAQRFCSVTAAEIVLQNDLEARDREFGCDAPVGVWPGMRSVTLELELYEVDDEATKALYQAARQRSPIGIMFQLGGAPGELFGVYLKSLVPEVPEFDDSDNRVRWRFGGCRAQGTVDDEIYVAFA
ncbi:MAG: phage tail tube protein, partial [Bryobacteraceae bacterium]